MSHNSHTDTELNVIVYDSGLPGRARWVQMPSRAVVKLAAHFRVPNASADEFNRSLAELLRQLLDEVADGDSSPAGPEATANYIWRAAVSSILERYGFRTWHPKLLLERTFAIKVEQCQLGLRFDLRAVLKNYLPQVNTSNADREAVATCTSSRGVSSRAFAFQKASAGDCSWLTQKRDPSSTASGM